MGWIDVILGPQLDEAEIRRRLDSAWLMRDDRRRLERQLERLTAAGGAGKQRAPREPAQSQQAAPAPDPQLPVLTFPEPADVTGDLPPELMAASPQAEAYGRYDKKWNTYLVDVTLPALTAPHRYDTVMHYDSCASLVALSHADARGMGLSLHQLDYGPVTVIRGTREEPAAAIVIPVMRIGPITIEDVRALIEKRDSGKSLLGQTALRKLGSVTQQGDTVIFRK